MPVGGIFFSFLEIFSSVVLVFTFVSTVAVPYSVQDFSDLRIHFCDVADRFLELTDVRDLLALDGVQFPLQSLVLGVDGLTIYLVCIELHL